MKAGRCEIPESETLGFVTHITASYTHQHILCQVPKLQSIQDGVKVR